VYVDESGLQENLNREYVRGAKGQRVVGEVSGKRTARTSIIAGLQGSRPIAPLYFQGYCNTEVVLTWVKEALLPMLSPGMTIIWDNASFHKSPKIKEVIEAVGCELLFLPPYSPDLNPIEKWWAKLKAWIRKVKQNGKTLQDSLHQVFGKLMN
jgi:transposase